MNRHQGPGGAQLRNFTIERLKVDGDEPRLPVVTVNNIRANTQPTNRLEHGPVEKDEPLAIVFVVFAST